MSVVPQFTTSQIDDRYIRENFRKLQDFLNTESPFVGFKLFTATFSAAEANRKISHNLGFLPLDFILTSKIGVGSVTFNQDLTTLTDINVTVSDAVTIRFLAGIFG